MLAVLQGFVALVAAAVAHPTNVATLTMLYALDILYLTCFVAHFTLPLWSGHGARIRSRQAIVQSALSIKHWVVWASLAPEELLLLAVFGPAARAVALMRLNRLLRLVPVSGGLQRCC